jgi:cysteine-rich repeat protein
MILGSALAFGCGGGGGDDGDDEVPGDCGDGDLNEGEECDDGNTNAGDGCDDSCVAESATTYRANAVFVRDPHLFALDGGFDITEQVNDLINEGITMDTDEPPDGLLEISILFNFRPVSPASAETRVDAVLGADCTAPIEGTTCTSGAETDVVETVATNSDGTCLELVADSIHDPDAPQIWFDEPYDPAITVPSGDCFATDAEQVTLVVGGVELALDDTQVAAVYGAGAPDTLESGLLIGFMTEERANNTILPKDLPIVGGQTLGSLLDHNEGEMEDHNGTPGWWFYINFTAATVEYTE